MYRSFFSSAKRLTHGQQWKYNKQFNAIKNCNNYNPNVVVIQCDTLEKINHLQKLVKKQKEKILKNLLENMKKETF